MGIFSVLYQNKLKIIAKIHKNIYKKLKKCMILMTISLSIHNVCSFNIDIKLRFVYGILFV